MKYPVLKIGSAYLVFTAIYYAIATKISMSYYEQTDDEMRKVFSVFKTIFFWAEANLYYSAVIVLSSLIGMIWAKRNGYKRAFRVFIFICICFFLFLLIMFFIDYITE